VRGGRFSYVAPRKNETDTVLWNYLCLRFLNRLVSVAASRNPFIVYFDQNILSHLREGKRARDELRRLLDKLSGDDTLFVYSMTHVHEIRDSSQPESFVRVIEETPVYLMEFQQASDRRTAFSLGRAHELLLSPEDSVHHASRAIEEILKVVHSSSGWLGDVEAQVLLGEIVTNWDAYWNSLQSDFDVEISGMKNSAEVRHLVEAARRAITESIRALPLQEDRAELTAALARLRERLPKNPAQLDEVPDESAVPFVFSCLDDRDQEGMRAHYPQGFWNRWETRETGKLAGLAFGLFVCGFVRDRRVKSGTNERRYKHFRGQYRDCIHIENAARCGAFVTCDNRAARLARSLYAYAGVNTKVLELTLPKCLL